MKSLLGGVAALFMVAPAMAQDHPPLAGNFKKLASCVYRALDAERPGLFRMTDLGDATDLTMEVHGGGMTMQAFRATFTRISDGVTQLEVEGMPPGYFAGKVRPLATDCTPH